MCKKCEVCETCQYSDQRRRERGTPAHSPKWRLSALSTMGNDGSRQRRLGLMPMLYEYCDIQQKMHLLRLLIFTMDAHSANNAFTKTVIFTWTPMLYENWDIRQIMLNLSSVIILSTSDAAMSLSWIPFSGVMRSPCHSKTTMELQRQ